jgi:hypothetical protein
MAFVAEYNEVQYLGFLYKKTDMEVLLSSFRTLLSELTI